MSEIFYMWHKLSGAGVLLEGIFHKKGKHIILDSKGVKVRICEGRYCRNSADIFCTSIINSM